MAVDWSIELGGSVLHLRSGPHFSSADLEDAVRAAARDPAARLPFALLWDNRESEESASQQNILCRVEFGAARSDLLMNSVAVVVSDPLHFGLARMAASYAENREISIEIFSEVEAAREWLARVVAKVAEKPAPRIR